MLVFITCTENLIENKVDVFTFFGVLIEQVNVCLVESCFTKKGLKMSLLIK